MEYFYYNIQSNGTLLYDIDKMSYGFRINERSFIDVLSFTSVKLLTPSIINDLSVEFMCTNVELFYNNLFFIDSFYIFDYFPYDNTYINTYLMNSTNSTIVNIFYNLK